MTTAAAAIEREAHRHAEAGDEYPEQRLHDESRCRYPSGHCAAARRTFNSGLPCPQDFARPRSATSRPRTRRASSQ
eukprot:3724388-Heterocapsa_arctica.AAC.1